MYPKSFVRSLGSMAWDFSTDAEFAEHLDWMGELVRDEIQPLEVLELEAVTTSD